MTDADFLLSVLSDGEPHSLNEILSRSFRERGCGLTVHSRAAELRKRGHVITNEHVPFTKSESVYRLALREPEASGASGSRSAGDHCTYPDAGVAEPPSKAPRSVPSPPDSGAVLLPEAAAPEQLTLEAA